MRSKTVKVGEVRLHDKYGEYEVISYNGASDVTIRFKDTGYTYSLSAKEIKHNWVRDHTQVRIFDIGINDAGYKVIEKVHKGRGSLNKSKCPFWTKWSSMLDRCYSNKYRGYDEVYVCEEWLTFSKFKSWMETQEWEGKVLDKDLLGDSKLYGPNNCCFIDKKLNSFISVLRGGRLLGARFLKTSGNYSVYCCNPFTGKRDYLGVYTSPVEAHLAWKAKKHEHACSYADLQDDFRVAQALRERYATDKDWCFL